MSSTHDPLLTVDQAVDLLGTGPSLPLELIRKQRIDSEEGPDGPRVRVSALVGFVSSLGSEGDAR